jgi:hypothetical protein
MRSLVMVLPANLVLLPFFARRLVEGTGKWWAVLGIGIAASLSWVVLATVGWCIVHHDWPWFWDLALSALIPILPVIVILVPLLAFWLGGAVRRWGLYWRD